MGIYKEEETRILVVDDVLENIQVIGKILREKGFGISVAQSGQQALDIVRKKLPDLILLDVMMPEMDGFETCRKLKQDKASCKIPVIFLTALSETKEKIKGFKAGAVDYVTKPIETEELLARIDLHLTVKTLQEKLEHQVIERTRDLVDVNRALVKREEEYRTVMKAVPDPIIVYDLNRTVVYLNPAFTRVFGWTRKDLVGKKADFVVEGEGDKTCSALEAVYEKGHISDFETRRYTKDGRILDVSISSASYQDPEGRDMGIVVNLRDITEWKQTREVMVQNEKMMSLGGLAAGMAHEIKNPVSAIIQNSQLLQNRLFSNLPANLEIAKACGLSFESLGQYLKKRRIHHIIESFLDSGRRVNTIVENMLSFSRKSDSQFLSCDLRELMEKTISLAEQDYNLKKKQDFSAIRIIRDYPTDLPQVPCEDSKIQQVFFNILKNGSEAMQDDETGQLKGDAPSPEFVIRMIQDGDWVSIDIEDNGPGIPQEICNRIFEPFYTTKEAGVGTGLGLSISYFIVKKGHKGDIKVASVPGKGTCFTIRLPLVQARR